MRFPLLPILILLAFNALVDVYIYCVAATSSRKRWPAKVQLWSAVFFALALIATICMPKRGGSENEFLWVLWMLFGYLSIYAGKIIYVLGDIISRLPRLWKARRWKWVARTGLVLGIGLFSAMWWGALFNRFRVNVIDKSVYLSDLPAAFDGFRIAQISDLHVGTFGTDPEFLDKLVAEVNAQKPDLIVFTGDIVNRRSCELPPFTQALSRLKAPYGVYSVMGNHDYGDYASWESDGAKEEDVRNLQAMQAKMGWKMLNNAHDIIRVKGDSIALIGVENVGDPPFKTYGDLSRAYADINDPTVKILLSHNPAHWETDLRDNKNSNIALTLSGHTHAMQMEAFGYSPAALRYKYWGGLYSDNKGQYLYVNIGAGTVGFPSRIGATPEITIITLKDRK